VKQNIFKIISKRAQILLKRKEGSDVEFKSQLNGLDASDIVAFANSREGGAIFIGVDEKTDGKGIQEVVIVGCDVGDKEKQVILSKAQSCIPPVDVEIFVENLSVKPFFRIEIPGGLDKPYCTASGTYKVRGDGRSNPLLPNQLLSMFIDAESGRFFDRFKEATKELEKELKTLKNRLATEITNIYKGQKEQPR
jgi:ATP-dependent DNA helicase RecG